MNRISSIAGQTLLITGASRGIGAALARKFASHGANLILTARTLESLAALAAELSQHHPVTVQTLACDLAQPEGPQQLHAQVMALGIGIDMLVNNAGMVSYGRFAETDLARETAMMQLNMLSPTQLAKLFLPDMLARGSGRIVNVASLGGYQPGGPMWAVYFATKSYLLSFSKALSVELRGTGVGVSVLCPGATRTDFMKENGLGDTLVYRYFSMDADEVAEAAYRGILRGKTVIIPGLINKLLALAGELPPRRIALEVNALLVKSER